MQYDSKTKHAQVLKVLPFRDKTSLPIQLQERRSYKSVNVCEHNKVRQFTD